ncbi:MAG: ATP-binding protein [Bacillota bacterium]|nr:ATP-binding protein [Bacillota bacterium]
MFRTATLFSFMSFDACIIYLYFGIMVYRLNMKSKINTQFFLLCLSFAEWSFAFAFIYDAPTKAAAWSWYRIAVIGLGTYEVMAIQFFFALTKVRRTALTRVINILVYIPLVLQIVTISGKTMITDFVSTKFGWVEIFATKSPILWIQLFNVVFCILLGLTLTFLWYRRTKLPNEKKQAKLIFVIGIFSFFPGAINNIVLPLAHITIMPSLGQLFLVVFIIGISYSIKNYNLMTLTAEIAVNEIISKIMDMLVLTDQYGMIIKVNKNLEEMLGYEEKELLAKSFGELVEEPLVEVVEKVARGSDTIKSMELNYRTKNEDLLPVKASMSSIIDKNGFVLGMVIVAHDMRLTKKLQDEVSERMKIAQSLMESNEKLKELDKLKSDFLSTVSHELRTPLTSVLGFAKIIRKKLEETIYPVLPDGDKKVERTMSVLLDNIDIILVEGERLTNLINDVLDIEKMEAGKIELRLEEVEIGSVIKKSIAVFSSMAEQKGIRLINESEESLPKIVCDKDRITQVIANLLSNAIKFTDKGAVTCFATQSGNNIRISIKDDGIGIEAENLTAVFDKFKQIGDTMTDKPKGTGLGLPICKQIVEYHGGKIWVESEFGKGSNFIFLLPVNGDSLKETKDEIIKNSVHSDINNKNPECEKNSKVVLVADDEAAIRKLVIEGLEECNYVIEEANDGLSTIQMAKKLKPDVIILDIMMPGINGFDVTAVLKNDPETANIPIVVISIIENKERGLKSGADYYLLKPIDMEELVDILGKLICTE